MASKAYYNVSIIQISCYNRIFLSEVVIWPNGHRLGFTTIARILTHWPRASEYL